MIKTIYFTRAPDQPPHPQTCCECKELIFGSELSDMRREVHEDFEDIPKDAPQYYHGDCYDDLAHEYAEDERMFELWKEDIEPCSTP